jgi:hypothetical protein
MRVMSAAQFIHRITDEQSRTLIWKSNFTNLSLKALHTNNMTHGVQWTVYNIYNYYFKHPFLAIR